jgi:hypothetical protein
MAEQEPVTELCAFSSPGAVPTEWAQARAGLGDAIRDGSALVYRVAPAKVPGSGKGRKFSQTRWRFSRP